MPANPPGPQGSGRRIFKNVVFLSSARGFAILFRLLVYRVMWGYLGEGGIADFVLILNTGLLLLPLLSMGTSHIVIRETATRGTHPDQLVGGAFAIRLGVALVCAAVLVAVNLTQPWARQIHLALWLMLAGSVLNSLADGCLSMLLGRERMVFDLLATLLTRAVGLAGAVIAWRLDLGLTGVFAGFTIGALAQFVMLGGACRSHMPGLRPSLASRAALRLLGQSWPIALDFFLLQSMTRFQPFVLAVMADSGFLRRIDIALFDAPSRIFAYMMPLVAAGPLAVFPLLSRKAKRSGKETGGAIALTAKLLLFVGLGVCVGLAAFPRTVLDFLTRGKGLEAIPLYLILVWTVPVNFLIPLIRMGFISQGRQLALAGVTAAALVLNIALNVIMIRTYGLIGTAWATLATTVLYLFAMVALLNRSAPLRIAWWRLLIPAGLATAGYAAVFHLDTLAWKSAVLVAWGCVYLASVFFLGAFSPEERKSIRSILPGRRNRGANQDESVD